MSKIVSGTSLKTIVIVNPQAGNGKTAKIWSSLEPLLKQSIGPFKSIQTTCRGEAKYLTRQELDYGALRIVAVGGDGHLNEVINGFIENDLPVSNEAALSFLMTGTGCDFQRTLHIPTNWQSAVDKLKHSQGRNIDLGKVNFTTSENRKQVRYFGNIASFG